MTPQHESRLQGFLALIAACLMVVGAQIAMAGEMGEWVWGSSSAGGGGGGTKVHKWNANITTNALDLTIQTTFDGTGCMILGNLDHGVISALNCGTLGGEELIFPVGATVTGFGIILTGTVNGSSQCGFQLSDSSNVLFGTEIDIDGSVDVVTPGTIYSVTGLTQSVSAGDWIAVQARESSGVGGTCSAQNFGQHWMYITYEDA
jgi:hypothetical protein